jgi:polysaccharide export outer membrane protein
MVTKTMVLGAIVAALLTVGGESLHGVCYGQPKEISRPARGGTLTNYIIGAGDILRVSVWKQEALERKATVLPDGTISLPLIGELEASGKTVPQLKNEIREKISRVVFDPIVTLSVEEIGSMVIYVVGQVTDPGQFQIASKVNVLQALAMAKGCNAFAKKSEIKIFRQSGGEIEIFDFDYKEVSNGKNLDQNRFLERGDVIVVP